MYFREIPIENNANCWVHPPYNESNVYTQLVPLNYPNISLDDFDSKSETSYQLMYFSGSMILRITLGAIHKWYPILGRWVGFQKSESSYVKKPLV